MPTFFHGLSEEVLKASYKHLSPQELFTMATASHGFKRKQIINFLFEHHHSAEAIYYQQKLLQSSSPYLPDEQVIRAAMAFYSPEAYINTLLYLLRQKYGDDSSFRESLLSEDYFFDNLKQIEQAVDDGRKLENAILALVEKAILFTNEQRNLFLTHLWRTLKYPIISADILVYVFQNLLPLMTQEEIDRSIERAWQNHRIKYQDSITLLLPYAKNASIQLSQERLSDDITPFMHLIPLEQRLTFLEYILNDTNTLENHKAFLQSLIPQMTSEQLEKTLKLPLTLAFSEGSESIRKEKIVTTVAVVLKYAQEHQLSPILRQISPYLGYLEPKLWNQFVNYFGRTFFQTEKIVLNEAHCCTALRWLQSMAIHADPKELSPLLPLVRAGIKHQSYLISEEAKFLFFLFIIHLKAEGIEKTELLDSIDDLIRGFDYLIEDRVLWTHETRVDLLKQLLSVTPKEWRESAIQRVLDAFLLDEKLSRILYLETRASVLTPYLNTHRSLLIARLNQSLIKNQLTEQFWEAVALSVPFLSRKELEPFFMKIETASKISPPILNVIQAMALKMTEGQRNIVYSILHDQWNQISVGKGSTLAALFPYLTAPQSGDSLKLLFGNKNVLPSLKVIQSIIPYIHQEDVFYTVEKLIEYIKDSYGDNSVKSITHFMSNLGPRLNQQQQVFFLDSILQYCNEDSNDNQIKALMALLPYLTNQLDTANRLDLCCKVNSEKLKKYFSPVVFFPNFLNFSDPQLAIAPTHEQLQQLQKEHQSYIEHVLVWINTDSKTYKERHSLLQMLLQWASGDSLRLSSIQRGIVNVERDENMPEFDTLKHLIQMHELLEEAPVPTLSSK